MTANPKPPAPSTTTTSSTKVSAPKGPTAAPKVPVPAKAPGLQATPVVSKPAPIQKSTKAGKPNPKPLVPSLQPSIAGPTVSVAVETTITPLPAIQTPVVTPPEPAAAVVVPSAPEPGVGGTHNDVLEAEADTLKRVFVPEDEVEMVASRSVSPAPSHISVCPSPAPSRCPSPIATTRVASPSVEDTIQDPPADTTDTAISTSFFGPSSTAVVSNRSKASQRVKSPLPDASADRPKRTITKTSKLILMEEASSRRGKKRGAENNDLSVNQAPAKRRRGGRRT